MPKRFGVSVSNPIKREFAGSGIVKIKPTHGQKQEAISHYLNKWTESAEDPIIKEALIRAQVKRGVRSLESQVDETFEKRFHAFLLGRMDEERDDGGPYTKTPIWGNRHTSLMQDPEVKKYIKEINHERDEFDTYITFLKLRGPITWDGKSKFGPPDMMAYYLYFKYVLEEHVEKDTDTYLADWRKWKAPKDYNNGVYQYKPDGTSKAINRAPYSTTTHPYGPGPRDHTWATGEGTEWRADESTNRYNKQWVKRAYGQVPTAPSLGDFQQFADASNYPTGTTDKIVTQSVPTADNNIDNDDDDLGTELQDLIARINSLPEHTDSLGSMDIDELDIDAIVADAQADLAAEEARKEIAKIEADAKAKADADAKAAADARLAAQQNAGTGTSAKPVSGFDPQAFAAASTKPLQTKPSVAALNVVAKSKGKGPAALDYERKVKERQQREKEAEEAAARLAEAQRALEQKKKEAKEADERAAEARRKHQAIVGKNVQPIINQYEAMATDTQEDDAASAMSVSSSDSDESIKKEKASAVVTTVDQLPAFQRPTIAPTQSTKPPVVTRGNYQPKSAPPKKAEKGHIYVPQPGTPRVREPWKPVTPQPNMAEKLMKAAEDALRNVKDMAKSDKRKLLEKNNRLINNAVQQAIIIEPDAFKVYDKFLDGTLAVNFKGVTKTMNECVEDAINLIYDPSDDNKSVADALIDVKTTIDSMLDDVDDNALKSLFIIYFEITDFEALYSAFMDNKQYVAATEKAHKVGRLTKREKEIQKLEYAKQKLGNSYADSGQIELINKQIKALDRMGNAAHKSAKKTEFEMRKQPDTAKYISTLSETASEGSDLSETATGELIPFPLDQIETVIPLGVIQYVQTPLDALREIHNWAVGGSELRHLVKTLRKYDGILKADNDDAYQSVKDVIKDWQLALDDAMRNCYNDPDLKATGVTILPYDDLLASIKAGNVDKDTIRFNFVYTYISQVIPSSALRPYAYAPEFLEQLDAVLTELLLGPKEGEEPVTVEEEDVEEETTSKLQEVYESVSSIAKRAVALFTPSPRAVASPPPPASPRAMAPSPPAVSALALKEAEQKVANALTIAKELKTDKGAKKIVTKNKSSRDHQIETMYQLGIIDDQRLGKYAHNPTMPLYPGDVEALEKSRKKLLNQLVFHEIIDAKQKQNYAASRGLMITGEQVKALKSKRAALVKEMADHYIIDPKQKEAYLNDVLLPIDYGHLTDLQDERAEKQAEETRELTKQTMTMRQAGKKVVNVQRAVSGFQKPRTKPKNELLNMGIYNADAVYDDVNEEYGEYQAPPQRKLKRSSSITSLDAVKYAVKDIPPLAMDELVAYVNDDKGKQKLSRYGLLTVATGKSEDIMADLTSSHLFHILYKAYKQKARIPYKTKKGEDKIRHATVRKEWYERTLERIAQVAADTLSEDMTVEEIEAHLDTFDSIEGPETEKGILSKMLNQDQMSKDDKKLYNELLKRFPGKKGRKESAEDKIIRLYLNALKNAWETQLQLKSNQISKP